MISKDLLPWHHDAWQQFADARSSGRLGHGLLLRGPAGLGKRRFAEAAASSLLCTDSEPEPCGVCRGCTLRAGGNHPDFFRLVPDEDKTQIRVEQIRDLIARLSLSSQMRGYKVVVIDPAEAMNVNAQNSLLKTLEEPPTATQLLLITSRPALLAPTVLSRCQSLRFRVPDTAAALAWLGSEDANTDWGPVLALAGGAPLKAGQLAADGAGKLATTLARDLAGLLSSRVDPVTVAEDWSRGEMLLRLRWLQRLVYLLVRWRVQGEVPELVHSSLTKSLQKPIAATSVKDLFRYLDAVERVIGLADRTVNQTLTILPLLTAWNGGLRFDRIVNETL